MTAYTQPPEPGRTAPRRSRPVPLALRLTPTHPPHPGRPAPRRSRPGPLVIGIMLALAGFPLLLGGLGLGWAMATQRDDDGVFSSRTEPLTTATVAPPRGGGPV